MTLGGLANRSGRFENEANIQLCLKARHDLTVAQCDDQLGPNIRKFIQSKYQVSFCNSTFISNRHKPICVVKTRLQEIKNSNPTTKLSYVRRFMNTLIFHSISCFNSITLYQANVDTSHYLYNTVSS